MARAAHSHRTVTVSYTHLDVYKRQAPGLDWAEYFRSAGLGIQARFIVWQPTAFTGESALVASTSLDTWKDWLAFHLIEDYATILPKAFADERFAFFDQTLSGITKQRSRHTGGVTLVNLSLIHISARELAYLRTRPKAS